MNFKWLGLLGVIGVLYGGDQIRLNRPAHKYRLSMTVETPDGLKSASGVFSVHPDRGSGPSRATITRGDALFVDLGNGRNVVALLLTHGERGMDVEGINYIALRAFSVGGRRLSFSNVGQVTGDAAVTGDLIPVLVSFADLNDPNSARAIPPDDFEGTFGKGVRLRGLRVEVVPNGLWPVDFGGVLGEPVTRGIEGKLPWWNRPDHQAAAALRSAALTLPATFAAEAAFTRK